MEWALIRRLVISTVTAEPLKAEPLESGKKYRLYHAVDSWRLTDADSSRAPWAVAALMRSWSTALQGQASMGAPAFAG